MRPSIVPTSEQLLKLRRVDMLYYATKYEGNIFCGIVFGHKILRKNFSHRVYGEQNVKEIFFK